MIRSVPALLHERLPTDLPARSVHPRWTGGVVLVLLAPRKKGTAEHPLGHRYRRSSQRAGDPEGLCLDAHHLVCRHWDVAGFALT